MVSRISPLATWTCPFGMPSGTPATLPHVVVPRSSSQVRTPPFQGGDRQVEYYHDTFRRYADDAPVLTEPSSLIQPLVPSQHVEIPLIFELMSGQYWPEHPAILGRWCSSTRPILFKSSYQSSWATSWPGNLTRLKKVPTTNGKPNVLLATFTLCYIPDQGEAINSSAGPGSLPGSQELEATAAL